MEIVNDEESKDQVQLVNKLQLASNPGANEASIDDLIQKQKFIDNSVSVGEGQENLSVLPDNFRERRDLEQYFFTKEMIDKYITALMMRYQDKETIEKKLCLICCPSLATAFYERHDIHVSCLDIDTRFENLPGFKFFDL